MVELRRLAKSYDGQRWAVREINLTIESGEFLVLLGESGCGKTTTLKMINRLIEPSSGDIFIDGKPVASESAIALRRRIGYVFQGIGLFPHLTIAKNIGIVPSLLRWEQSKIVDRTNELFDLIGLNVSTYAQRMPSELSGGQRQRVGVARALAAGPHLMLMDEPFGSLDPITRAALQNEFQTLQKKLGLTVIMVTHDIFEALQLADRIAVMFEGEIVAIGTPRELLKTPAHPYAEKLVTTPREQTKLLHALLRDDRDN